MILAKMPYRVMIVLIQDALGPLQMTFVARHAPIGKHALRRHYLTLESVLQSYAKRREVC